MAIPPADPARTMPARDAEFEDGLGKDILRGLKGRDDTVRGTR